MHNTSRQWGGPHQNYRSWTAGEPFGPQLLGTGWVLGLTAFATRSAGIPIISAGLAWARPELLVLKPSMSMSFTHMCEVHVEQDHHSTIRACSTKGSGLLCILGQSQAQMWLCRHLAHIGHTTARQADLGQLCPRSVGRAPPA